MSQSLRLTRAGVRAWALAPALWLFFLQLASAQGTTGSPQDSFAGTSWQLVRFQGGDGSILAPDDPTRYAIAFDTTGGMTARIDCNRGRGTWTSSGPNQVQFGPMALTRAQCPPGSLHDQIVKQWGNIRSYVLKDGHLFLSLMADGGVYEFEPAGGPQSVSFRSPVRPKGPATWMCTGGGQSQTLRVTFYPTRPALALLELEGVVKPAFQVHAASGARYEGDEVLFWEARGEATLDWMGRASTCKPR